MFSMNQRTEPFQMVKKVSRAEREGRSSALMRVRLLLAYF